MSMLVTFLAQARQHLLQLLRRQPNSSDHHTIRLTCGFKVD
jgi:hypothetical protein